MAQIQYDMADRSLAFLARLWLCHCSRLFPHCSKCTMQIASIIDHVHDVHNQEITQMSFSHSRVCLFQIQPR